MRQLKPFDAPRFTEESK